jgi:hypothetical protein
MSPSMKARLRERKDNLNVEAFNRTASVNLT